VQFVGRMILGGRRRATPSSADQREREGAAHTSDGGKSKGPASESGRYTSLRVALTAAFDRFFFGPN
jgi:hypothetical protein